MLTKKILMIGTAIAFSIVPISEAADYMNIGTYQTNESAFLSSSSGSSFIAGKWKEAEQQINNEAGRIEKNMAKDSDSEEQKKNKYKKLNEVIESPLIKTGTVSEQYKDANGHVFLKASGSTASGSFSEEGFATGNLSKSSKKVIMENRYGDAVSSEGTFDYMIFTKKTINEDGSWNAQSRLVVGDSNHPKFQTYYATITARGSANGEVHEFTRGIAIDVDKNIRNVEQSIVYNIGIDQYNLATALGSIPSETQNTDIELLDTKYNIIGSDDDIQQQCLNDGIDVSQCSIPSFLLEYSKLKANNDYEGIAKLTSGVIEKDALANADDEDANNLFAEIDGKVAAAGVLTLGAALGGYSVLRRKEDDDSSLNEDKFKEITLSDGRKVIVPNNLSTEDKMKALAGMGAMALAFTAITAAPIVAGIEGVGIGTTVESLSVAGAEIAPAMSGATGTATAVANETLSTANKALPYITKTNEIAVKVPRINTAESTASKVAEETASTVAKEATGTATKATSTAKETIKALENKGKEYSKIIEAGKLSEPVNTAKALINKSLTDAKIAKLNGSNLAQQALYGWYSAIQSAYKFKMGLLFGSFK